MAEKEGIRTMRKRLLIISMILVVTELLFGCGAKEPETKQYVQAEGVDRAYEVTFIGAEPEAETEEPVREPVQPEATGLEQEESRVALEDGDVYNQPSEDSVKIGSVKEGERIFLIEMVRDGAWCKINYNGRVAYITADAVGEEETENAPEERADEEIETEGETPVIPPAIPPGIAGNTEQPADPPNEEGGEAQNQEEVTDQEDESVENEMTVSGNLGGGVFGGRTQ